MTSQGNTRTHASRITGFLALRRSTVGMLAMAGFALVILIPAWQAVLAGAVLFISWSAISLPATMRFNTEGDQQVRISCGV